MHAVRRNDSVPACALCSSYKKERPRSRYSRRKPGRREAGTRTKPGSGQQRLLPLIQHASAHHVLAAAKAAVQRCLQVLGDACLHADRHRLLTAERRGTETHAEVGVAIHLRNRGDRRGCGNALTRHLVGLLDLLLLLRNLVAQTVQRRRHRRRNRIQLVHVDGIGAFRTRCDVRDLALLRCTTDRDHVRAPAVRRIRADGDGVRTRGHRRRGRVRRTHVGGDARVGQRARRGGVVIDDRRRQLA